MWLSRYILLTPKQNPVFAEESLRLGAGLLAGKSSIVEQLNEFIQELKDIDTSIAAHVRPRLSEMAFHHVAFLCALLSCAAAQTKGSTGNCYI